MDLCSCSTKLMHTKCRFCVTKADKHDFQLLAQHLTIGGKERKAGYAVVKILYKNAKLYHDELLILSTEIVGYCCTFFTTLHTFSLRFFSVSCFAYRIVSYLCCN